MKKILKSLLSFLIVFSLIVPTATTIAATKSAEKTSDIFTYTVSNDTATITRITVEPGAEVVIPDTIDGYQVTGIGSGTVSSVFDGTNYIKSVTLPGGLKSIGAFAFMAITTDEAILLPNSLTSIGESAFETAGTNLSITIPGGVTQISDNAFQGSSLEKVTILSGVQSIGERAFKGCSNLKSITLPDSITSIGDFAFSGCNLQSIQLPKKLKAISRYMFDSVDGSYPQLSSGITIPSSVKSIGAFAFGGCAFKKITIPEGVTSIGEGAFNDSSLQSIVIAKSVKTLGSGTPKSFQVFYGCSKLKSAYLLGKETSWSTNRNAFGVDYSSDESKATIYAQKGSKAERLAKLFKMKFVAKTSAELKALTKGASTSGSDKTSAKTKVAVPGSFAVKYTPFTVTCTWKEVPGATGYEIYNIDLLGKHILQGSTTTELSYTQTVAPHALFNFVVRAYKKVNGVKKYSAYSDYVNISADPDEVKSGDFTYYLYNGGAIITGCSSNSSDITIPDTIDGHDVTNVERSTFEYRAVSSVVFPKHMKRIDDGLLNVMQLEKVTIPEGVEVIGNGAFSATYLNYVVLPSSMKEIGGDSFSWLTTDEFMIFAAKGSYAQKYAKKNHFLFFDTSTGVSPTTISPLMPEASLASKYPYDNFTSSVGFLWGSSESGYGLSVVGNRLRFSVKDKDYMVELNKITKGKASVANTEVWVFSGRCRNLQDAGNTWDTEVTVTIQQNFDDIGNSAVTGIVMPKGIYGDEVNYKGGLVIEAFLE